MKDIIKNKIQEAKRKLDYSVTDFDERYRIVLGVEEFIRPYVDLYFDGIVSDKVLNDADMYAEEYLTDDAVENQIYNPHLICSSEDNIHTGTPLSENDFVCKFLEQLADYLLFDPEKSAEEKKQNRFEERSVINESTIMNKRDILRHDGTAQNDRDMIVLSGEAEPFKGNFKKEIKQKIFPEDTEKSEIIKEYYDFYLKLGNYKRNNNVGKQMQYKINRLMGDLKDDMIFVKNVEFGTINFKSPLPDDGQSNQSYILTDDWTYEDMRYQEKDLLCDFFDVDHYETILKMLPFVKMSDNLKKIGKKFDMLETYLNLSDEKSQMLDVLKNGKAYRFKNLFFSREQCSSNREMYQINKQALYDISSLARKLDWEYQKTKDTFDQLCLDCYNAFIEFYETEIYYMYLVRGKYKKCSICGEMKLFQNFGSEPKGKFGLKSSCSKCISGKNSSI